VLGPSRNVARALVSGALVAFAWLSPGCLIEIAPALSCGDGYVDLAAGEQCDPADPLRGFESSCVEAGMTPGKGGCDPETCQLVVSVEQCAVCGDNIAEGAEPCDGSDLRQPPCADAVCLDDCTFDLSLCPTCGNGQFDPEGDGECDASQLCRARAPEHGERRSCLHPDDPLVTEERSCETLEVLAVGIDTRVYARGSVTLEDCQDQCVYSREDCDFCGNGLLEPQHDDLGASGNYFTRAPEVCEVGPAGDNPAAQQFCAQYCTPGQPNARVLCEIECTGACTSFDLLYEGDPTLADPEDLGCCLAKGEPCGVAGQTLSCCGDAPGSPACQLDVGGTTPTFRCIPHGPPSVVVSHEPIAAPAR
jgi:hypothetical protein